MRTAMECLPCLMRQTLDAGRLLALDHESQEQIMRKVLRLMAVMDMSKSPPEMAQQIHRLIRETTGIADPYQEVKERLNETAMSLIPDLEDKVNSAIDPLMMAIRLAVSGNAVDMGVYGNLKAGDVCAAVERAFEEPFYGEVEDFRQALARAKSILYLADNTGEIVFDRMLIERISPSRVTLAVRGGAVINDATLEDAQAVGLDRIVKVVDNGSDAPGTVLEDCAPAFRKLFFDADLIISKGQGNYESLNTVPANIYFLFKTKCSVVQEHINQPVGTQVLVRTSANHH